MKKDFYDVYVNKIYGEAEECENCNGSGLVQYHDECEKCEGKGFIILENEEN